jgi:hypothetical protein
VVGIAFLVFTAVERVVAQNVQETQLYRSTQLVKKLFLRHSLRTENGWSYGQFTVALSENASSNECCRTWDHSVTVNNAELFKKILGMRQPSTSRKSCKR